jgi:4-aminobutyrate aminotransferase-like enzyme
VDGRVAFELGGAQAMELALKVASLNAGGGQIAVFEGAYHGRSVYTSQLSASARYRSAIDVRERVLRLPYPNCERCRFGRQRADCHLECVTFTRTTLGRDFAGITGGSGLAVAILEPVLNVGGMVFPDPEVMKELVEELRAAGALIIMDEIFTGLYRTGPQWGFQRYPGLVPDLIVFSKGFTNGVVPISGVWARDPLMDEEHFPPSTHSVTYGNNVFGLAVIDVVLDRYERQIERTSCVQRLESDLTDALSRVREGSSLVESVQVSGATARLQLTKPVASEVRAIARTCGYDHPIEDCHGLLIASTGIARDVICIHPPLTFSRADVEAMATMLGRTLASVEAHHG